MNGNAQIWAERIGKYLSGNCNEEERTLIENWISESDENNTFFEDMKSVWQITSPASQSINVDLDKQWGIVSEKIQAKRITFTSRRNVYRIVAAAAAVALLFFMLPNQQSDLNINSEPVVAGVGKESEKELVVLPDNTKVWLRPGSVITYDATFSPRSVSLVGEAFFEVTSDPENPFTVHTENAFVQVLGTRFNLKETIMGDVELFVEEGKVSFGQEDQPEAQSIVTRDQVALFKLQTLEVERVDGLDENRMSWKTNALVFDDAAFSSVLVDLERHYNVAFTVTDTAMLNCDLKAHFDNNTLTEVLETIQFVTGWNIENESDHFVLTGEPCLNIDK